MFTAPLMLSMVTAFSPLPVPPVSATQYAVAQLLLDALESTPRVPSEWEPTFGQLAIAIHTACKAYRHLPTCRQADLAYRRYFSHFDRSERTYALHFFWAELLYDQLGEYVRAATQYEWVIEEDQRRNRTKPAVGNGLFFEKAAYNRILAYSQLIPSSCPGGKDRCRARSLSKEAWAVVRAMDDYVALLPDGEHRLQLRFRAALLLYEGNELTLAAERFTALALEEPEGALDDGQVAGPRSAALALDCDALRSDHASQYARAQRFLLSPDLTKKYGAELEHARLRAGLKIGSLNRQVFAESSLRLAEQYPERADNFLADAEKVFDSLSDDRAMTIREQQQLAAERKSAAEAAEISPDDDDEAEQAEESDIVEESTDEEPEEEVAEASEADDGDEISEEP